MRREAYSIQTRTEAVQKVIQAAGVGKRGRAASRLSGQAGLQMDGGVQKGERERADRRIRAGTDFGNNGKGKFGDSIRSEASQRGTDR